MIDISPFENIIPDTDFINLVFKFDVRGLESIDGIEISKYCIILGQYLIFLRYQMNSTKVEILRKKRIMDGVIANLLTPELIKKYKTKTSAIAYLMSTVEQLVTLQEEISPMKDELMLLDGIDNQIHELIAAFKRELTRRENELYQIRRERK